MSWENLFLAHLSRRLIGELIVYPCSGVRRCRHHCCCRCPPFSNVFSSETAWSIKAKFYVEPPWEGGTKVCINGPGHMTKMATTPIYGKNLLQNRWTDFHKTWYVASGTPAHHSLYKWWPWVDLDLIYAKVKFGSIGISIGKSENSGFFRKYSSQWPESW